MTITVNQSNGLHLRPCSILVSIAKEFNAEITITFKGTTASTRNLPKLIALGVRQGDQIEIDSKNADALFTAIDFLESDTASTMRDYYNL